MTLKHQEGVIMLCLIFSFKASKIEMSSRIDDVFRILAGFNDYFYPGTLPRRLDIPQAGRTREVEGVPDLKPARLVA